MENITNYHFNKFGKVQKFEFIFSTDVRRSIIFSLFLMDCQISALIAILVASLLILCYEATMSHEVHVQKMN